MSSGAGGGGKNNFRSFSVARRSLSSYRDETAAKYVGKHHLFIIAEHRHANTFWTSLSGRIFVCLKNQDVVTSVLEEFSRFTLPSNHASISVWKRLELGEIHCLTHASLVSLDTLCCQTWVKLLIELTSQSHLGKPSGATSFGEGGERKVLLVTEFVRRKKWKVFFFDNQSTFHKKKEFTGKFWKKVVLAQGREDKRMMRKGLDYWYKEGVGKTWCLVWLHKQSLETRYTSRVQQLSHKEK